MTSITTVRAFNTLLPHYRTNLDTLLPVPNMKNSRLSLLPLLGLFTTSTYADFIIGKYAGSEIGGTFSTPGQLHIIETWNSAGNLPAQPP